VHYQASINEYRYIANCIIVVGLKIIIIEAETARMDGKSVHEPHYIHISGIVLVVFEGI